MERLRGRRHARPESRRQSGNGQAGRPRPGERRRKPAEPLVRRLADGEDLKKKRENVDFERGRSAGLKQLEKRSRSWAVVSRWPTRRCPDRRAAGRRHQWWNRWGLRRAAGSNQRTGAGRRRYSGGFRGEYVPEGMGFGGGRVGRGLDRRKSPPPPAPPPFVVREYAHQHPSSPAGSRTDFTETVFWHPVLVLPKDGAKCRST